MAQSTLLVSYQHAEKPTDKEGDLQQQEYLETPPSVNHTEIEEQHASIPNEIVNLIKNIVGSGGLSLPAGIGAFANHPSAIYPSMVLMIIMAIVNAYSFSLLGQVCCATQSKTYKQAWDRTVGMLYYNDKENENDKDILLAKEETTPLSRPATANGEKTRRQLNMIVALVVTGKAFLGCWAFSIMIASTCKPLLQLCGWTTVTRSGALLSITIVMLFPLCLAERLSSLAGFSVVGEVGTLVTAFTMALRYMDGSYREGGRFYDDIAPKYQPSFGTDKGASAFLTPQAFILLSILSTGYVAHYNAPKFYHELLDHTPRRFNIVVTISFSFAALTYMTISSLGFLTFGSNSAGFILDNYSAHDPWATVSRFGIAFSVIFAYPLLFLGGRDGLLDLLSIRQHADSTSLRVISVVVLAIVTGLALGIDDLTFVLSFGGATLSTCIIYVFPPLMFRALVLNNAETVSKYVDSSKSATQVKIAMAVLYVGSVVGLCGAIITVGKTFFG